VKFGELKFRDISMTHGRGGIQACYELGNGWYISIARHKLTYGREKGLYEIAIFSASGEQVYFPSWSNDSKAMLNELAVEEEIHKVESEFKAKL